MSTYRCTCTYYKIALDRPHLNEDSVSASLKEMSKRFQILIRPKINWRPVNPASYGTGFANVLSWSCITIMKWTSPLNETGIEQQKLLLLISNLYIKIAWFSILRRNKGFQPSLGCRRMRRKIDNEAGCLILQNCKSDIKEEFPRSPKWYPHSQKEVLAC